MITRVTLNLKIKQIKPKLTFKRENTPPDFAAVFKQKEQG
ncbi:hypothetical protein TW89_1772 [Neisseria flavescens]|nr:hypothetical protein TW89_1772 [Neisseria flavescens]